MATTHRTLSRKFAWASVLLIGAAQLSQACADTATSGNTSPEAGGEGGVDSMAGDGAGGSVKMSSGGKQSKPQVVSQAGSIAVGGVAGTKATGGSGGSGGSGGTQPIAPAGGAGGEGGAAGIWCQNSLTVVANDDHAASLALSGGYVYWTTRALSGSVRRAPVDGGAAQTIAAGELYPYAVAVAGEHVFWTALGGQPGHLFQASLTGADRQLLATGEFSAIYSLQADASYVYYVSNLNDVDRIPVGGGAVNKLTGGPFDSMITDMVLDGTNLFWTNDGIHMFETTQPETATINSMAADGSAAPSALITRLDYPQFEIAVDEHNAFWSDQAAIYRTTKVGGASSTLVTLPMAPPDESPIVDMASDGANVYYTDGHQVLRVSVEGGSPSVLTDGWARITQLALDDDAVYFTDYVRGEVVKVAKCGSSVHAEVEPSGQGGAPADLPADEAQAGAAGASGDAGCVHGCPEPEVAAPATHAYGLTIDDDYLYYTTLDASGSVMRLPLTTGPAEPLASNEPYPHDMAVDDVSVYWCLNDVPAGHLASMPKGGGTRVALASGLGTAGLGRVTSDGAFAYYVTAFNSVYRVAVGGGVPGVVAAGPWNSNATDLAFYQGDLFWTNDGTWNANYTLKFPGTAYVGRTPVSGSANLGRVTIDNGLDTPLYRVAADASNVYFINNDFVYKANASDGMAAPLAPVAPAAGPFYDLLSDGKHVYFANAHAVYRLPVTGGAIETLTYGWGSLRSLAVDDTTLYFTDYAGGQVLKRPK